MPASKAADANASAVVLRLRFVGHLTEESLQRELAQVEPELARDEAYVLVVDCTQMTGYAAEARSLFTTWNAEHRHHIRKVAIAVSNPLWHMVIATMGLLSSQSMRAFGSVEAAETWAAER